MGTVELLGSSFPMYCSQISSLLHLMLKLNEPQSWACCLVQGHLQDPHVLWGGLRDNLSLLHDFTAPGI